MFVFCCFQLSVVILCLQRTRWCFSSPNKLVVNSEGLSLVFTCFTFDPDQSRLLLLTFVVSCDDAQMCDEADTFTVVIR